tara:strand:+ start:17018 stop:18208 length:1191 start_codon:yes stop_codon:yes gene_type:complete
MTDSQLTQCPHCKASFKVSEEQLNAANGRVRCGACLNVFDAIAYQITPPTKHDKTFTSEQTNTSILDEDFSFELDDAVDLEDELLGNDKADINAKDDSSVFADDPEEDKLEKGYSGSTKFGDELSASFLELDKSSTDPFKTQFLKDDSPEISDTETVDESWTSNILDDLEEPSHDKVEPNFNLNDKIDEPESIDLSPSPEPFLANDSPHFDQKDLNALKFQYDQDPTPKKNWLTGTVLFLVNLALLILLITQASWFHYEKLVKYPKLAEAYKFACSQLGCTLPVLSDVSKIENRNLVVRSHPTTFNALIIETIITNHANFEQKFPNISLTFSNINNQVVAQRLFKPSEYLNQDVLEWPGMPSEQPIQITLEIIDPGAEAVNYKMNFHLPQSSNIDQ